MRLSHDATKGSLLVPLIAGDSRPRPPTSRTRLLSRVAIFDLIWAGLSPLLAFLLRDGAINHPDIVTIYCGIAFVFSLISFQWFKISAPIASFFSVHDASKIAQACLTSVALTAAALFTFNRLEDAPRSILFIHLSILLGGLLSQRTIHRLAARPYAGSIGVWNGRAENILIVEASRLAWFFSKMVEEFAAREMRIVAILDERPELHHRSLNGYSIVGSPTHLAKVIDEYASHGIEMHRVVIAMHPDKLRPALWEDIRGTCELKGIRTEWLYERLLISPSAIAESVAELAMDVLPAASIASGRYWKLKRLLDIAFALTAIIVAAPVLLAVALLVFLDVGVPIVFWQQRIGHLGRRLQIYKFRTMRSSFDCEGHAVPESLRLSSLGRMLRRNRLDEIPQLFNILSGDMSLVGPRPLLPADQPKDVRARLQVKPGITGLAQINGGKLLSAEEKDALDEWYVQHASPWLDVKIIIRTILVVMRGDRRNEAEISAALADRSLRVGTPV